MKKILVIASLFVLFAGHAIAQTDKPKDTKKATTGSTSSAAKSATAPTKKDGSADMRYKVNKDSAKKAQTATVHTKKDGTADKRYKENKKPS